MRQSFKRLLIAGMLGCWITASLVGCSSEHHDSFSGEVISDVVIPDGSAETEWDTASRGETTVIPMKEIPTSYGTYQQTAGYEHLTPDSAQNLYHLLEEAVYTIGTEQNANGYYYLGKVTVFGESLSEETIKLAITAFKNDHPEIFWISNVYGRGYQNGNTIVQLYSYVSSEECNRKIKTLETALKEITEEMVSDQSEYQRELAAFQAVVERCGYDSETASGKEKKWQSYTAYGALVDGSAVCEGYSRAMQLLLNTLNVECRLVNGVAGNTNHMWNLVKIEGEWYHLDATWNDQQEVVLYDYFNLTDEMIRQDHEIAPELSSMTQETLSSYMEKGTPYNFTLPQCTAEKYCYLKRNGLSLETFGDGESRRIISSLQETAERHGEAAYFYVSDQIDFDMVLNRLFKGRSPKILSYIDGANRQYGIPQINREQIRYISNETMRSVTVMLRYR